MALRVPLLCSAGWPMPGIDYRKLRAQITMVEVLDLLGLVVAARSAEQVRGECPLHQPSQKGSHRSFSAQLGRKMYQCFKCGAKGNHLHLWAKATKQSLYQAALDLCARLNKKVPPLKSGTEKRNS